MNWGAIILLGIAAGILSGLFGVGGGTILVPLFIYVLKMDIHTATGTSLAVIVPTAIIGVLSQHLAGNVNWKIVVLIALLSVIGVFVGVKLNAMLPSSVLQKMFAVFLFCIAIQLFFFDK